MKPITQHKDYLLAWEDVSNKFFLLCNTTYENQPETFCIQLPIHIRDQYIREGHNNLMRWIKRIDEDYQVGRFSESNPRLMFQYVVATAEQKNEVLNCFENKISLMDQEIIRLLYLMSDAELKIYSEIALGKNVPIEIFCLAFRFLYRDRPLVDKAGNQILAGASEKSALKVLEKNPVYGCRDAGAMLLGILTRRERKTIHLNCLEKIVDQPNFSYAKQRLLKYIEKASHFNYITIKDPQSGYRELIEEFENEFPKWSNFSLNETESVPHWMFMEGALSWESDCLSCLKKEFLNQNINVSWDMVGQALFLLHGYDRDFHGYSIGQAVNFGNVDPTKFTKETVPKPIFPATGNEEFIVGVWQTYFRLFDKKEYSRDTLKTVLDNFVLNWNQEVIKVKEHISAYEIPEWMMNNFTSWLSEFDNDSPYQIRNLEISFEEAKARYSNTLRKVCDANVIEFADLLLICDLADLICSRVQHSHYPPCDVCRTLYQEYKNRMDQ